jgi:YfiH family protein
LNTAFGTGDDRDRVRQNLGRIEGTLGVGEGRLCFPSQVHGTEAVVLHGTESLADVFERRADVTMSRSPAVACAVRSADCGTILLGELRTGAVAAIHSGWRGTVQNVASHAIEKLRSVAGGELDLVAAIGPHIEACCFEVGDDVAAELAACSAAGEGAVDRSRDKPHVDLRRIMQAQLVASGVGVDRIEHVPGCTVCDAERFFSYRRDGASSGRLLSAIVAR